MNNIIIGTAGHIDHGKTTLIKALTGRETDRLKEEKERGISIELGFTYFDLPNGERAGIIDVPGHEKLIKTMLAGISGVDIIVLVIAADEGIMPQTKEHLDILNLLGMKNGLIAMTKTDLVDEEWLELMKEDIKDRMKGTFLEDKEIIEVSSITGKGIDKIKNSILEISKSIEEKDLSGSARLPVDRVFSILGFGTVVTGTLISGAMEEGEEVQVYPKSIKGRVRNIQVHGNSVKKAYSGQRVAMNIAGLKTSDISRGEIIAAESTMEITRMLDVKIKVLDDFQKIIETRNRLRLYIGSSEILCRITILDKEKLTPGDEGYAQLRLEEKIAVKRGDKFILRFYSPMMTLGGGFVLDANPKDKKNYGKVDIKALSEKEKGTDGEILEESIKTKGLDIPSFKDILRSFTWTEEKGLEEIGKLENNKRILTFSLSKDKYYFHKNSFEKLLIDIIEEIENYHKKYPLRKGISKEELRSKYLGSINKKLGEEILKEIIIRSNLVDNKDKVYIEGFSIVFEGENKKIKEEILKIYKENRLGNTKKVDLISGLVSRKYKKNNIEGVYEALIEDEKLIKLKEETIFLKEYFDDGVKIIIEHIEKNGKITASETREILGTNRKNAIIILETLDDMKITKRIENDRILF